MSHGASTDPGTEETGGGKPPWATMVSVKLVWGCFSSRGTSHLGVHQTEQPTAIFLWGHVLRVVSKLMMSQLEQERRTVGGEAHGAAS